MNLTDPRFIRAALQQHGFNFSKSMGQNFLIDPGVPRRIASYLDSSSGVLEIGPGFGALTRELCSSAARVVSIEVDRRLIPLLQQNLGEMKNLTLIQGDALKLDLDEIASGYFDGLDPTVAANLPYSITSDILAKLISSESYSRIIVMVQTEVAERLCASPGSKAYGAFTVFCGVCCKPEILFRVPAECFMPKPNVQSSVICLSRRVAPLVPEEKSKLFFRIVRGSFSQRRKTLRNSLSSALSLDSSVVSEVLEEAGVDPGHRGETLGISQFLDITKEMEKRLCGYHDGV